VFRVAGTHDVAPAALGHLHHRVAELRGAPAAFRNDTEPVLAAHRLAVHDQFLPFSQHDPDTVLASRPDAGDVVEALRLSALGTVPTVRLQRLLFNPRMSPTASLPTGMRIRACGDPSGREGFVGESWPEVFLTI
jgi:hypothetical protein